MGGIDVGRENVADDSHFLTHRLDSDTTVNRVGYGAMQLAGPNAWGPPALLEGGIVLRVICAHPAMWWAA
jgi:hypothetical protein